MYEMKTWKEATRLTTLEKIRIGLYIINIALDITVAIIGNNAAWAICALLWTTIAISEYSHLKINKGDEEIINALKKHTEIQSIIIATLIDETAIEVEINKIKIPEHFSKPNKNKLKERFEYYQENHKFKSPIVIDENYNLIDGYTSYLIAKNYNKTSVIAKVKRTNKTTNKEAEKENEIIKKVWG